MIHQKSVIELEKILSSFEDNLAEYDEDAKREKVKDYKLLPKNQLARIMRSEIPTREKKNVLLSQIGFLRINLFMEYDERIEILEKSNQLDEAINVMNECAQKISIPFIPRKKRLSLLISFLDLVSSKKVHKPFEYVQKWNAEYKNWCKNKHNKKNSFIMNQERRNKFKQLKEIFYMLYCLSFSDANFPPSPTIVFIGDART